ncbi:hypothetical protein OF122_18170 [Pelagibacterium flavum]|uniref:Uncharacterized protein n=1 Tax=Pelagibacterium flavum TaxID=2984530 RepID=A0ABY6IMW4_9HYPH|nr:hypothetical protein [Pelagibacterium sp. YIM 151497]UYQ71941.1 hypothetical protein OF122_18170 [Pelagibacterium sp. YIM 151497]
MTSFDPTRRNALIAIAAAPAALALPAHASTMGVQERIEFHSRALAEALGRMPGQWEMRVRGAAAPDEASELRTVGDPEREARQALADAQQALERLQPGRWRFNLDTDHAYALIIRDDDGPLRADDITGTTAYADWERSKISS